jgi:hypothetical protein
MVVFMVACVLQKVYTVLQGLAPVRFWPAVAVNRRKSLRFVCTVGSYCPMPDFEFFEGSSCANQPSHENLRRNAAENAL